MKTVAIIQARMSSSRLPGKMLMDIEGKPLIERVMERAHAVDLFNDVILATSDDASDDPLAAFGEAKGMHVFRGNLNDVLDRLYSAAQSVQAECIIRLTGDCPLLDPAVICKVVQTFQTGEFDYVSNALKRTYPDGLDTEVCSTKALEIAHKQAALPSEREHVMPFIYKQPEWFRIGHVLHNRDLSQLRWTVDEQRDLEFVRTVYREIGKDMFGMDDILALLKRKPQISAINKGIPMNAGKQKSLEEDARFSQG